MEPHLPPARPGGRLRSTCLRGVLDAILYLLRTGCRWRLLPREYPLWSTVHHDFRSWWRTGVWTLLHHSVYEAARAATGRSACPSMVIMDRQSVKTTEREPASGRKAGHREAARARVPHHRAHLNSGAQVDLWSPPARLARPQPPVEQGLQSERSYLQSHAQGRGDPVHAATDRTKMTLLARAPTIHPDHSVGGGQNWKGTLIRDDEREMLSSTRW